MKQTDELLARVLVNIRRPRVMAPSEVTRSIQCTALRLLRHKCSDAMLNHDSFGLVSQQELKEFLLAKFEDRDHEGVKTTIELQLQQLAIREQIEFRGQRVRALYGHSLWNILVGTVDCPPPLLWHTTADRHREAILLGGLRKRNRSYIHLTSQFSYAAELAMSNSLSQDPILLAVDTQKCLDLGAVFRKPNSHVWLTNRVPPSTVRVVCESAGWWHQPPLRN